MGSYFLIFLLDGGEWLALRSGRCTSRRIVILSTTTLVRSLQGSPDGSIFVGVFLKNARTKTMEFMH